MPFFVPFIIYAGAAAVAAYGTNKISQKIKDKHCAKCKKAFGITKWETKCDVCTRALCYDCTFDKIFRGEHKRFCSTCFEAKDSSRSPLERKEDELLECQEKLEEYEADEEAEWEQESQKNLHDVFRRY